MTDSQWVTNRDSVLYCIWEGCWNNHDLSTGVSTHLCRGSDVLSRVVSSEWDSCLWGVGTDVGDLFGLSTLSDSSVFLPVVCGLMQACMLFSQLLHFWLQPSFHTLIDPKIVAINQRQWYNANGVFVLSTNVCTRLAIGGFSSYFSISIILE